LTYVYCGLNFFDPFTPLLVQAKSTKPCSRFEKQGFISSGHLYLQNNAVRL
jgi:hypothetical protein